MKWKARHTGRQGRPRQLPLGGLFRLLPLLAASLSCNGDVLLEGPGGGAGGGGVRRPGLFPPPPSFEFKGNVAPNPLISRGKPARSSVGSAAHINDGHYRWSGSWSTNEQEGWVAIHIGQGASSLPRRVLVEWSSGVNYNYLEPSGQNYGFPTAYALEVSADSTDGSNGHWSTVVSEADNQVRTRTHLVANEAGIAWVRMQIRSRNNVHLDEIDIYDATDGSYDSWFFLGDSITAHAFDRSREHGSFAENIAAQGRGFFPAVINGGVGGDRTGHALERLNSALAEHPAVQFWAISLGSNNVGTGNDGYGLAQFRSELLELITRIQDNGRIPIIPRIPFIGEWNGQACRASRPDVPKFNAVIEELIAETGALPGPDLYAYFEVNCRQLPDGLHPDAAGYTAMNRLWAEAMESIYRSPAP